MVEQEEQVTREAKNLEKTMKRAKEELTLEEWNDLVNLASLTIGNVECSSV